MNLEHIFGTSLSVEIIYALGDDNHRTSLLPQPSLTLCYSQMGSIGPLAHHQLPSVVVELPDPRWSAREGLWSGQVLRMHKYCIWRFQFKVLRLRHQQSKLLFSDTVIRQIIKCNKIQMSVRARYTYIHTYTFLKCVIKDNCRIFPKGKYCCSTQHEFRLCNKHHYSLYWLLLLR